MKKKRNFSSNKNIICKYVSEIVMLDSLPFWLGYLLARMDD